MNGTIHLKSYARVVKAWRRKVIGKTVIVYARKRKIILPETSVDYGF